jgi:hypothetical protein
MDACRSLTLCMSGRPEPGADHSDQNAALANSLATGMHPRRCVLHGRVVSIQQRHRTCDDDDDDADADAVAIDRRPIIGGSALVVVVVATLLSAPCVYVTT